MKWIKIIVCLALLTAIAPSSWAIKGVLATDADIQRLKIDLRDGKIQVGKTRLKNIRRSYGDAPSITDSEKKITYDYGDLKLDFDKTRYWIDWTYDGFKRAVYTDSVDDLRFDLESEELVGKNITADSIRRSYGEPTEINETNEDGEITVYYYGDIKMVFENQFFVRTWRGKNLRIEKDEGVLGSE